jgi:DNA (cytosine-5)-methyltransferase 1
MPQQRMPIAIDLFCGCGGVTEGLKQSGFKVVAAVDNDPICCATYRANHPDVELFEGDIRNINPKEMQRKCSVKKLDLLIVCAPCQPFSSLNKKHGIDPRVNLILQAIRFAKVLKPKYIFFENVPGLSRYTNIIDELRKELEILGYRLSDPLQVDAADYNVPQRRIRCIMIATTKKKNIKIPSPVTPEGNRFTVRKAFLSLPINYNDPLNTERKHSSITIKRLKYVPHDGGSRYDIPFELWLSCHKKLGNDKSSFPDVLGRISWDYVAPTLTTGCTDVTKGRFAHPEQDRAITLREAALLQTFPITYKFCGKSEDIARQIGNAVPVNLIRSFAPVFLTRPTRRTSK